MRVLIFSDIHGNLPAFEKMLKAEPDIDSYISLGDVVNYGPWSNECVDLVESLPAVRLMGNHERYFIAGSYPGKSFLVQEFFETCVSRFTRMEQIVKYREVYKVDDYTCTHTLDDAYVYPDSVIDVNGNFFIGHSHHQFDRREKGYRVVNVGSVGQNRKEINVIDYALYYPGARTVELKSLVYDTTPLINKMKELRYPSACIDYYLKKSLRE